jgi:hypothetical protein
MGNDNKKSNVYQRIHAVMNEIGTIEKRGRNDFHKYDYATEADYVHALRPLLDKHGLVVIPQVNSTNVSTPDEKGNILTTIDMSFWICNIDDPKEQVHVKVPAQGSDKGDKGVYKALTGAKKYFAALTFLVATGDDPENDGQRKSSSNGFKKKKKSQSTEDTEF